MNKYLMNEYLLNEYLMNKYLLLAYICLYLYIKLFYYILSRIIKYCATSSNPYNIFIHIKNIFYIQNYLFYTI